MSDTDELIKNATIDIICVVTIWGLINTNNNNKTYNLYGYILATGSSCFIIFKYINALK